MQTIIQYLRREISKSTSSTDRAMLTGLINPCYVGDTPAVENLSIKIEHGEYSEELKIVAGWVQVLLSEPNILSQLITADVVTST